jgi:hypothetical protein
MRPLRFAAAFAITALSIAPVAHAQAPGFPDPELVQRGLCGATLAADQSLLLGTVRSPDGTPAGGLRVAAMWTEAVLSRQGSQTLLRASVDTTAPDGTYALCGLPRETRVTLRADGEVERSGELSVVIADQGVIERDLVVAGPTPTATVTGRLQGSSGSAVTGSIQVPGDSAAAVTTDSAGAFRLTGVPRRSSQLLIRAIGYVPHYVDVTPDGPLVDLGALEMPARVQELSEMVIEETFASRERREFEERKRSLNGVFLDSAYLAQFAWRSANNLKMASPKIRGTSGPGGDVFRLRRGADECFPLVFLNGRYAGRQGGPGPQAGGMPANEMRGLLQRATRIEFYQATFAPPEFADFEGCGAMVIWIR